MKRPTSSPWQFRVHRALRALGGEGTLGDIIALTGLDREEVETALDALGTVERAHVRVTDSGDVIYHVGETCGEDLRQTSPPEPTTRLGWAGFDRKTVQLIRAREGVISLAELVEHTGLLLVEAREEMSRLAEHYGGVPHVSLDGHVVYAFPELMSSAHGAFPTREPRPAWVRLADPIRSSRSDRLRDGLRLSLSLAGVASALTLPWLLRDLAPGVFLLIAGACAVGLVVCGRELKRSVTEHRLLRFRHARSVRRYLLGLVIETALAGKGVVSLGRAVRYLRARAGKHGVSRFAVEAALRGLAAEFDAPVTETGGELFFGFRNIKRQFLASHVVRRRLCLGRRAHGATVFDTADLPIVAGQRELDAFDRALREGQTS